MPSTSVRNTFVWQIAVFNSTSNHDFVCKPAALSVSANRDNIERGVDIETRRLSTQTSDALDRYIEHTLLVSTQSRRQKLNTRRCNLAAPQPTTTTYLSSPCFWQCTTSGHLLGLTCTFRSSDTKVGPIRVDSVCRTLAWERLKTQKQSWRGLGANPAPSAQGNLCSSLVGLEPRAVQHDDDVDGVESDDDDDDDDDD